MSKDNWFSKGKINSRNVYETLYSQVKEKINQNISVLDILRWIEEEVKTAYKETNKDKSEIALSQGAVNNCRGRWNEFLITSFLAQIAIDLHSSRQLSFVAFRLPSSGQTNKTGRAGRASNKTH